VVSTITLIADFDDEAGLAAYASHPEHLPVIAALTRQLVGDSLRDLLAGSRAGCQPHLVLTGKSAGLSPEQAKQGLPEGSRVHADLAAFADFLIERGAAAA
jgi:phosphoglycolate phosphatase-like HAD superfamily hydrolase